MPVSLIESAGLGASHIRLPPEEAEALALSRYGIAGRAVRFETEKDDTFRLAAGDGRIHVLKVANPRENDDEIALQVALLDHLAGRDCGTAVPRVVPAADGAAISLYRDRAGQMRSVRLLTYLHGAPLSDTVSTAAEREKIGRVLARLRLAMADFSHPADGRELAWDIRHLARLEPLLPHIADREKRELVARGLARFAALAGRLDGARMQVLHNDFSRSNIVVDHDDPRFVTGIIDFGDAVRTAIAVDVSTALLNQLPSCARDDLFLEGRDLLSGYLAVADLTEGELALVPHLVMGRVVARALITHWRSAMLPENATYIMRNTAQGWAQLEWFLARSADEISDKFLESTAGLAAGRPDMKETADAGE